MKFKITAAMLGVALNPTLAVAHSKVVSAKPAANADAARTKVVTLAVAAVRTSLALETGAAISILVLVAWLGTLASSL